MYVIETQVFRTFNTVHVCVQWFTISVMLVQSDILPVEVKWRSSIAYVLVVKDPVVPLWDVRERRGGILVRRTSFYSALYPGADAIVATESASHGFRCTGAEASWRGLFRPRVSGASVCGRWQSYHITTPGDGEKSKIGNPSSHLTSQRSCSPAI
jgi:hypothetical protein